MFFNKQKVARTSGSVQEERDFTEQMTLEFES